ncbi:hypothetical protein GH722_20580, partial [Alphaproteobacteria bacterium HT1-32]|nr:hypothetical protein [Alphaproteobacteria bacterium HT1-32]
IDYGADGAADGSPTALQYDDLDWALEGPAGLTSQGEAVTYSWDAATNTLQATADGRDVFTVELNEDGSYTFTLQDSLDHGAADGENSLGLEFTLTGTPSDDVATDYDLDPSTLADTSISQTFSVNVTDDVPEAAEVATPTVADTVTLDEDDLADGTDDTKESLSASGDLGLDGDLITIDYGADGAADGSPTALQYDDLDWALEGPAGLTSQGEAVTYSWDAATNTLQATADGRDVFTVELNEDGSYTFTLQDSLDHGAADGENSLGLEFTLTGTPSDDVATDYDLDPSTLADTSISQTFSVNVTDDVPEAAVVEPDQAGSETLTVTNMGQESASHQNSYGYYIQNEDGEPVSGQIIWSNTKEDIGDTFSIEGVDPDNVGFFVIPNGNAVNSGIENGMNVTFQQDGDGNWQVVTEGGQVLVGTGTDALFTNQSLNEDGLDHEQDSGAPGSQNWEDLHNGGDLDYNDINVDVERAVTTVTLDEDDLADGTDEDKESLSASGTLGLDGDLITINYGADGPADGAPTALQYDDLNFELTGPAGITSQGEPVTYEWDASTNTLQASADGRDVFTVELNADGTFTFTLQDSLDHGAADGENSLGLEFTLTGTPDDAVLTDYDLDPAMVGDLSVTQTFSVNVTDDVPEAAEVATPTVADTVTLDEDDLADGTDDTKESLSASGDLGLDGDLITINYGADGPVDGAPTALAYSDLTFEVAGPAGLLSGGNPVSYQWDASTNTLQASAGGEDVFTVQLNEDGTYTFTLQGSLDHGAADGQNSLGLEFTLTGTPDVEAGTDYDLDPGVLEGVSITQTFSVNVTDDVPEAAEVATPTVADTVTLDEDDLADGTDDTKESLSATGDLGLDGDLITIDYGADGAADGSPTALQYDDLDWALEGPAGLTSQGEAVTYSWDAATNTLQATADGRDVFTVELNEDGSYTFTLQDSLDHGAADGENSLGLEFTLTGTPSDDVATDYDLDPSTLADTSITQTFSVNVTDDVPEAAEVATPTAADTVTLDEDDLADGTDDTKESLSATGDLGLDGDLITIDYGADGAADGSPTALQYDDLDWALEGPAGLTSQGEAVTYSWDAATNTLQATADGRDVFTVELNEDGSYTFTLQDSLDHGAADGENSLGLEFTLTGTPSDDVATDYDLDPSTLADTSISQIFSVNVTDDVPEAAEVATPTVADTVTLDEDDLADGTDDTKESLSASGDLGLDGDLITIDYGADGAADGSPTALQYDDLDWALEGPASLTSQGEAVTYSWDAATQTLQATADGRDVFTVELNEDGSYTFTLQDSLDHGAADGENSLGLEFTLTGTPSDDVATDYDLDPSTLADTSISQTFSVNVTDDVPEAAEVATPTVADTVTLDEDDLADGTDDTKESLSATGDLGLDGDLITIDYGADGAADGSPTALQYDDLDWALEGPAGLTSQGEAVTYSWDAATNTLQATADGRDVFTVELNEDGSYTFTLQDSLDHGAADGENSLGLEFTLTGTPSDDVATDYDLDPSTLADTSITQTFSVNVTDDVPEAAEVATPTVADTVTLDEDDLADGTDDTKESLSATGDLGLDGDLITIDYGADGAADGSPTALQYDDLDWALEGPAGLTSQGEAVTYSWDAATNTLQATADGRDVFTVELNEDGSYTFTLQDSLDHGAADGENSLGLEFTLTGTPSDDVATDYDLDPSTLADTSITQTFSVNVTDDVPEAAEVATPTAADTVTLDEDDLADGTDDTKESLSATGDLGLDGDLITIDYGADGAADGSPTALQYDDLDWALEGPAGLTSQGDAVTYSWDAATNTLQATADGRDVFTVELNEDGSYTFTLQDSLDHGAADGENSLGLEFTLTGTPSDDVATDYDLDPSTLADTSISQTFSVNVTDDVPEAAEVATPTVADTVTLDEDDLADGTDDTKESLSATGDLGLDGDLITIDYGADGAADGSPTALQYDDLDWALEGPAGLTSQGEAVTYSWDAATNTLQATADGRDVFTVELNEDGSYTFTLQDSLDHGAADGENSLGLEFTLTGTPSDDVATDYDLDPSTLADTSITQTFSVNVTDDVPEAAEVATPTVADTVTLDEDDLADGTDDTKESLSATG